MRMAKTYRKNIFCLEGDWTKDLKNTQSIKSALDFLYHNIDIKYIHRNCATSEQMKYYLEKFTQKKYDSYTICYLAFHGKPNTLLVGKEIISLDELAEMVGDKLKYKIVHLGSCETLFTNKKNIERFIYKTNALAVCGYKTEVDFLSSSIFDMLFFEMCQQSKKITTIEKQMKIYYGNLIKKLGFRLIYI